MSRPASLPPDGAAERSTLSVLVPHYDDPDGLELSLRSIETQTWQGSIEVVVVDDGSAPEHQGKLEAAVGSCRVPVRLIRNGRNRGRPYTRNVLLDAAEGSWLAWLDAGDEFYQEKLAWQIERLSYARYENLGGPVWCTCHYHWHALSGDAPPKLVTQGVDGDQASQLFLGTLRGYLWTLVGTAQSFRDVGYFDLELPRLQDVDFFLRFVEKGGRLLLPLTDQPLCVYQKSDLGRSARQVLRCNERLLRKHAPLLMQHSRRYRGNREVQQFQLAARYALSNRDYRAAAAILARAAVAHPLHFGGLLLKMQGWI